MPEHQPGRLRGAAAAVFGAFAFAALLIGVYSRHATIVIGMDRDIPPMALGFYPVERANGRWYAWTRTQAQVSVPGIDRRVDWHWNARTILWRPPGSPLPTVRIAADGVVLMQRLLEHDFEMVDVKVPHRPGTTGVTLTIDTVPGFVPGPSDSRQLGIAVESMSFSPVRERPFPPWRALVGGALAILVLGSALTAIGLPTLWVLGSTLLAGSAQVWAMLRGLAAYAPYPAELPVLALGIGLGTWLVVRVLATLTHHPLSGTARGVAALSAVVCYLKLLILLHPGMPAGDGVFHAHRFEYVLNGRFFFTSLAPGNYSFPYPILLYVFATPFSALASSTLSKVALLRIVVTVADAGAGAMLYWMVVRAAANRRVAVAAVLWYHLVPMTAWIMTWGNLTNAFGQTLFVASLVLVVALPVEWGRRRTIALLTVLASAALLSHPSTCAILTLVLGVTTFLYWWRGDPRLRNAALGVGAGTLAAASLAFVLYYAWFPNLYLRELGRAAAESGTRIATTSPDSPIGSRLMSIPDLAGSYLGWPAIVAAAIGGWRLIKDNGSPRLLWLLVGWIGTCVAFLAIGIVTPIQMRTHFAVFPAIALAAAFGWNWGWRGRPVFQAAAVLVMGAAVWVGLRQWIAMLG